MDVPPRDGTRTTRAPYACNRELAALATKSRVLVSRTCAGATYSNPETQFLLRGSLVSSRVSGSPHLATGVELTGIMKLARQKVNQDEDGFYLTTMVELIARKRGEKIFESFHILTIPERQAANYRAVRKQFQQTVKSDLRRLVPLVDLKHN